VRSVARAALVAAALLLAACAQVQPLPPLPVAVSYAMPAADASFYEKAAAAGQQVLAIDPARSLIVVTVRRGGPLARLGHDHVVASHDLRGMVAPALGRADFGFRLDQLVVDETALRDEAKLETTPSPEAIAGTRHNMLSRVLEAERFPQVALQVAAAPGADGQLQLSVTLHGVTRTLPVRTTLARTAAGLTASGAFTLKQSDFGITPMSIMNGAMTVQDTLELRYRIVAGKP